MQSKMSDSLSPQYASRGGAEQRQEEQHDTSGASMRRANLILHNQAGSTLVGAVVFSFVMMLSALALMRVGSTDATLAVRDVRAAQAFYLAEAGVERGQTWLAAQTITPDSRTFPFGIDPDTLAGGIYSVWIQPDSSSTRPVWTVRSSAALDRHATTIEVDVTPRWFTDYLYYVNRNLGPGQTPWFFGGETIDGPLHVNDYVGIWGDPVFTSHVQSSESEFIYANGGFPIYSSAASNPPNDEPTFEDGYSLGLPEVPWLQQSDLHTLRDQAELRIGGATDVVFGRTPGLIGYVSHSGHGRDRWTDVPLDSFNGIIYVSGDCYVRGVVDGQATLCSNGQISIEGDITYYDSDADGPSEGCDDILGLAAGTRINVVDNVPNGNDCVIHAHILAVNNQGGFVENYAHGSPRGTLTIHGGIAQDKWGPFGIGFIVDGEYVPLTGYIRDIHYDGRFAYMLPPGYLDMITGLGVYTRIAWREMATH